MSVYRSWLDEAARFEVALRDEGADRRQADARARAERLGVVLRHPPITHQPAPPGDVPARVTGWARTTLADALAAEALR